MTSSYSPKEVTKMIEIYEDNPCLEVVNKLSVLLNRPRKSIISKLVKEGVYVRRGYRTKLGTIPETKLQILRKLEDITGSSYPGLDKAQKSTLLLLYNDIKDMSDTLEEVFGELSEAEELRRVRQEMSRSK
jgi:hypothetical protein